jgi:hypothetical protein
MFHSQDGQDKYLETNIFKGFKNGFFVDVGAHDGISINNHLYFERHNGWTGINIEPIESVYNKLVTSRDAINVRTTFLSFSIGNSFLKKFCTSFMYFLKNLDF